MNVTNVLVLVLDASMWMGWLWIERQSNQHFPFADHCISSNRNLIYSIWELCTHHRNWPKTNLFYSSYCLCARVWPLDLRLMLLEYVQCLRFIPHTKWQLWFFLKFISPHTTTSVASINKSQSFYFHLIQWTIAGNRFTSLNINVPTCRLFPSSSPTQCEYCNFILSPIWFMGRFGVAASCDESA